MKLEKGRVYRLKEANFSGDGWLWVFETRNVEADWYCFRSVATGLSLDFHEPAYWFEEAEDETGEG
jgi:hypothetical protein